MKCNLFSSKLLEVHSVGIRGRSQKRLLNNKRRTVSQTVRESVRFPRRELYPLNGGYTFPMQMGNGLSYADFQLLLLSTSMITQHNTNFNVRSTFYISCHCRRDRVRYVRPWDRFLFLPDFATIQSRREFSSRLKQNLRHSTSPHLPGP